MHLPHATDIQEILRELNSTEAGLSDEEAQDRIRDYGLNEITAKTNKTAFAIILTQFKSPLVWLLAIAAGLSAAYSEWVDGIAILLVIILNAFIGFIMEYRADRSVNALKKLVDFTAKVKRNGHLIEIPTKNVVPGDILFFEAGDLIPADSRIISSANLQVDEASLTGESLPVSKEPILLSPDAPLAERRNILFKGTPVTRGNAHAVVFNTGMKTELGKIATMVQSTDEAQTPLEKKIKSFSNKLIVLTLVLAAIILITGLLYGSPIVELIETSIALAVAAIPEGLPVVTTLALAAGTMRMARRNVIIKRLSSVETLGSTTVICTDKTGTLTQNRMAVTSLITADAEFLLENADLLSLPGGKEIDLIAKISALCNTAEVEFGTAPRELGDPLEIGLLKFAHATGQNIESLRRRFPKVLEEPFNPETRLMTTIHKTDTGYFVAVKGAVEEIIKKCTHYSINGEEQPTTMAFTESVLKMTNRYAHQGFRLIGFAYALSDTAASSRNNKFVYVGMAGMVDPIRPEVPAAVEECKTAGIKIIMMTGDHAGTALHIAEKVGIAHENDKCLTGTQMDAAQSEPDRKEWLSTRVFARVSPKNKMDMIEVLRGNHNIVAMTGDGINDAPALKKADIGIAMGLRGTQAAQEAAEMVLKDDSFASIAFAVRQGRIIFDNIRKSVIFLLSCNLSELFVITSIGILNFHFQLLPIQILVINLVTDVLPALALGVNPGSVDVMKRKPRDPSLPLLSRNHWTSVFLYAGIIAGCVISAVFISHYGIHKTGEMQSKLCNNILFLTLIFSQLFNVFSIGGSAKAGFFKNEVFRNKYAWLALLICSSIVILFYNIPFIASILVLYEMSFADWLVIIACSIASFGLISILKRLQVIS